MVSAIARRRPKAEGSPGFLIGDWANEAERRLGKKASYRIIKEEEEAYRFCQHLLHFAGATLMSLQFAEYAAGICCRLLDPKAGAAITQNMFSPDSGSRKRTLGQLNQEMRERQIFIPAFEQRMNAFVKRRNRFAHQSLLEYLPLAQLEHAVRMTGFRDLESSIGTLLREANEITATFFGLFTAIGVTSAERENVKNLEALLDNRGFLDWREQLRKFAAVRRQR